jgi:ATP-dependent Lon protease
MVRGVMRYTIRSLYEEKIYLEARVAPLNDSPTDEPPSPLREQAISLHARYSEMMTGRPVIEQNESKVPVSFILASVAQMPNDLKQKLLELTTEHARLELLIGHYQTVISEVSPKAEVERIVKSNGILKH